MWPFTKEKVSRKENDGAPAFRDWPKPEVFRLIRDLTSTDAELRFWLPETALVALKAVTAEDETWISAYIREFAVIYLYGETTLRRMKRERSGLYYVPPLETLGAADTGIRFSRMRATETVPGLGKNLYPVKVFLPVRLKEQLQIAADASRKPLSTMMRELLIGHLLGNRVLLERYIDWSASEAEIADAWCSGTIDPEIVYGDEPVPVGSAVVED